MEFLPWALDGRQLDEVSSRADHGTWLLPEAHLVVVGVLWISFLTNWFEVKPVSFSYLGVLAGFNWVLLRTYWSRSNDFLFQLRLHFGALHLPHHRHAVLELFLRFSHFIVLFSKLVLIVQSFDNLFVFGIFLDIAPWRYMHIDLISKLHD